MTDFVEKWGRYADAHRQYRADYLAKAKGRRFTCGDELETLRRLGWAEIPVNPTTDLNALFTSELTGLVSGFFGSHFAVVFRGEMERGPEDRDESAFWHRDSGPFAHLRLLVPLVESDGGTAVVSLTEPVDYDPVTLNERRSNLEGLGEHTPWLVTPPVGEALIIQASRVLHRAVPPSKGVRKIFQVGLIPSLEPWQVFDRKHPLLRKNTNSFPEYEIDNAC